MNAALPLPIKHQKKGKKKIREGWQWGCAGYRHFKRLLLKVVDS
jgi:hypothetical protein